MHSAAEGVLVKAIQPIKRVQRAAPCRTQHAIYSIHRIEDDMLFSVHGHIALATKNATEAKLASRALAVMGNDVCRVAALAASTPALLVFALPVTATKFACGGIRHLHGLLSGGPVMLLIGKESFATTGHSSSTP